MYSTYTFSVKLPFALDCIRLGPEACSVQLYFLLSSTVFVLLKAYSL
jgi:hypothetical protein